MEITKEEFQRYEEIKTSGVTNMLDIGLVSLLSSLDRDEVLEVVRHYDELSKKYPGVKKGEKQ